MLMALRPKRTICFRSLGKIRTSGVRSANVGAFEVKDYAFDKSSIAAEGRNAWDAVFGTVTLGKFFLGFGSVGICEHAFEETAAHLRQRQLYGKPAIDMPHLRSNVSRAYARLTAMKLYAYRALDYVHSASPDDRRYLLFCAVQKARVSTEGVKVMGLLQECIGAKGFESSTYFEMALRDVPLIPSLEGSMHINLGLAVQFISRYFEQENSELEDPPSLVGGEVASRENTYLMEARTGSNHTVAFRHFLEAYRPLMSIPSVAVFAHQVEIFRQLATQERPQQEGLSNLDYEMALGQCFATVVYGQLIAENAVRLEIPGEMTSAIFSVLVEDLSSLALRLVAIPDIDDSNRDRVLQMVAVPAVSAADWDVVARRFLP
jgi:acyl-CoA dehydrogenase